MLAILEDTLAQDAKSELIACRLAELAQRIDLPEDATRPEEIIRLEHSRR